MISGRHGAVMQPKPRMVWRRSAVFGALALAVLATMRSPVRACDMVCVAPDNYEAMLRSYKHVLVGRVEHVAVPGQLYPNFVVKTVRAWKGGKKQLTLVNVAGQCGKTPRANRLYVVFANDDPEGIDLCSPVIGLWEQQAKLAVTRLDRARHFPPLSVDAQDLKP